METDKVANIPPRTYMTYLTYITLRESPSVEARIVSPGCRAELHKPELGMVWLGRVGKVQPAVHSLTHRVLKV